MREMLIKLGDKFWTDPLMTLAIAAGLIALASTPIAFAVLGNTKWFEARRGRVMLKPAFWSVVCSMMLVMGIPAIFLALVVKSESFDKDRYEFDPNKSWSVLEQGRGYATIKAADEGVRVEMARLADERKNLLNSVKKLDEAMIRLRAVAGTSAQVAATIPDVLQTLAAVRKSVGLDGPQQLIDLTAPPVELAAIGGGTTGAPANLAPAPVAAVAAAPAPGPGLTKEQADAELATVPAPQKPLAAFLPLTDLPGGWMVAKSGDRYLETFNAENLFEKIDGRAESFTQYDVRGMAYTYYHPIGDDSNEVQLYIFEMANPLKALGKYGSEKPDGVSVQPIGTEGYTSAGSTLFYTGKYYIQIVSTKDHSTFADFALNLAGRIAKAMKGGEGAGASPGQKKEATPEDLFALLPDGPAKANPKYIAQDVFGYAFLSDVFMADYQDGDVAFQGFIRPYADPAAAKAVLEEYLAGAKLDGAEVKELPAEGADKIVVSSNIGLVDVLILKGNALAGVNGSTDGAKAEVFAKGFAKSLPTVVPIVDTGSAKKPEAGGDESK
ncbi:DUF6599 family protein [Isosphaeraceae bacterium EP7]